MFERKDFLPPARLSEKATRIEFCLPNNSIADYVARSFELVWLNESGTTHPGIWHPGLIYPGARPATVEEIDTYRNSLKTTIEP